MGRLRLFELFKRIKNYHLFSFTISLCFVLGAVHPAYAADEQPDATTTKATDGGGGDKPRQLKIGEIIDVTATTSDEACLECHGVDGFAVPKGEVGESPKRGLFIEPDNLKYSVHAEQSCMDCHGDIKKMPHEKDVERTVDCVGCHKEQSAEKQMAGTDKLTHNAKNYLASVHAKSSEANPDEPNAQCWDCHGKHNVFPIEDKSAQTYRITTPETCGTCHEEQLQHYRNSVHGAAVVRFGDMDAAVCSDCHTAHQIDDPESDPVKLVLTANCGNCHEQALETYSDTYHGQINKLGYAHTAKCFNCHGGHEILPLDNPDNKVSDSNRLETCRECHKGAPEGFLGFFPHGHAGDYDKYPEIWVASKFMIALVIWVFLFFWTHTAMWFYREYQERKTGKVHVRLDEKGDPAKRQYVRRFSASWRIAHLVLAIAVMVLVLTGTTVLYADSFWAPTVMAMLGGPKVAAILHRISAITFAIIFFGHIAVAFYKIYVVNKGKFRWFGPDSLIPNWQDWDDFVAMCKWFVGKGERPTFDRWTYWEKFDYWAPFWGMFIIGLSGLTLWFPNFFGQFLPGWAFNVATIVHGEEAFLAAVFLFTVHFFNCHFRPDKFPQDTIMFTGSMTLEEFKEERAFEYKRLEEAGELESYLVGAPSIRMAKYSKVLGFTLIAVGLILLFLVLEGFTEGLFN